MLSTQSLASVKTDISVVDSAHASVHAALRERCAPHARRNYTTLAGQFDALARRFRDAARLVDPELDADSAIRSHANIQQAWNAAPELAAELDSLLPRLAAAAELYRGISMPCRLGNHDATMLIPLCVEVTPRLHRRRVWEAWHHHRQLWQTLPASLRTCSRLTTQNSAMTGFSRRAG